MPDPSLARRLAYDAWADREALRSVRDAGDAAPPRAREVLAHVVAAGRVWLGRLGHPSGDPNHPIWPDLSLDAIGAAFDDLARAWPEALGRLDAEALARPVAYTNQRGESFASRPGDILEHVLLHAHYHRGQVALLLGRAGLAPASTDFIVWVRSVESAPG